MANVTITSLPTASALTGTEAVPVVQNGVTVQTTTGAIQATSNLSTYTFITVGTTAPLAGSRYLATGTGLGLTDNGPQSSIQIKLNGSSASLEAVGYGMLAKSTANTIINRSITISGNGLAISNGDGIAGNPTLSITGVLANFASVSGTGLLTINGTTVSQTLLAGVANQISVSNPSGLGGNPTIGIASNPVFPGTGSITTPAGGTSARPVSPINGMLRYNTDTGTFEAYANNVWGAIVSGSGVATFSAGTTGFSPTTPTTGAITLSGTLNVANGGTGATTLTGYVYGNGTGAMTSSTTIPTTSLSGNVTNAQLANSSITINGNSVSLGGSTTVTASTTSTLTIGTGLSGTSFNGSAPVTIAIANSGVTAGTYGSSTAIPNVTVNAQGQITSITTSALNSPAYQGTWNASTNTPTLTSNVGTNNNYYIVSTAGTTTLNGISLWSVGDWAIFNGTTNAWEKVLGSSSEAFSSLTVTGLTGYMYANGTSSVTASSTIPVTSLSGLGTGVATALAVNVGSSGAFVVNGGALGTPSSGTLTNATGLPISTGVSGLGTGVATALAVNIGSAGAFVVNGGALGTPSSGNVTNLTGTASININGTVGATTPTTGAFTTVSASGQITSTVATGTAPFVVASTTQVANLNAATAGTATNATNVALSSGSGATNYLTFSASATGNQPLTTNASLTYNYTNNALTAGINGGTF